MAITVGDKALYAVEQPGTLLLIPVRLEHHRLQVTTRIGLGEVHCTRLTTRYTGQVLRFDLLRSKLVERLSAILQSPDVLETSISTSHHLIRHYEEGEGEVEPLVFARKGEPEESSLVENLDILCRSGRILNVVVHHLRAIVIDPFGVGCQHITTHLTDDLHHTGVAIHRILEVEGCVVVGAFICVVALLEIDDLLHQRVVEVEAQVFIVGKKVCHFFPVLFAQRGV